MLEFYPMHDALQPLDEELALSRFHGDEAYDPAIIGQVVNTAGKRVLVYDELAVYDIHARLMLEGEGLSDEERNDLPVDLIRYNDPPDLNWPHRWVLALERCEEELPKTPEEAWDAWGLCWLRQGDVLYVTDQQSIDWDGYVRDKHNRRCPWNRPDRA